MARLTSLAFRPLFNPGHLLPPPQHTTVQEIRPLKPPSLWPPLGGREQSAGSRNHNHGTKEGQGGKHNSLTTSRRLTRPSGGVAHLSVRMGDVPGALFFRFYPAPGLLVGIIPTHGWREGGGGAALYTTFPSLSLFAVPTDSSFATIAPPSSSFPRVIPKPDSLTTFSPRSPPPFPIFRVLLVGRTFFRLWQVCVRAYLMRHWIGTLVCR